MKKRLVTTVIAWATMVLITAQPALAGTAYMG